MTNKIKNFKLHPESFIMLYGIVISITFIVVFEAYNYLLKVS